MLLIDDYKLEYKLGSGSFADVYYTTKKGTSDIFATKRVEKAKALSDKMKNYFLNEVDILKNTNHQNIIKLYEIKNSQNNFYLMMEYCNGGTLNDIFENYFDKKLRAFPESYVQHILRQVSCGLYYLHKSNIIHRDLKMENILFHYDSLEDKQNMNVLKAQLKIIDFGFAKYLNDSSVASSICGSPINMDPVILKALAFKQIGQDFGYTEKADMWSLGIMVYTMLIGKPPFIASNYKDLYLQINEGNYEIPKQLKLSKQAISLINGLLQFGHAERLSIDELVFHEFLTLDEKDFEFCELNMINKSLSDIKLNNKEDITKIWDNYQVKNENVNLGKIRGNLSKKSFIEEIDSNYNTYDSNKNFQAFYIDDKNNIIFTDKGQNPEGTQQNINNQNLQPTENQQVININNTENNNQNYIYNNNGNNNIESQNNHYSNQLNNLHPEQNINDIYQKEKDFSVQKEKINQINKEFSDLANMISKIEGDPNHYLSKNESLKAEKINNNQIPSNNIQYPQQQGTTQHYEYQTSNQPAQVIYYENNYINENANINRERKISYNTPAYTTTTNHNQETNNNQIIQHNQQIQNQNIINNNSFNGNNPYKEKTTKRVISSGRKSEDNQLHLNTSINHANPITNSNNHLTVTSTTNSNTSPIVYSSNDRSPNTIIQQNQNNIPQTSNFQSNNNNYINYGSNQSNERKYSIEENSNRKIVHSSNNLPYTENNFFIQKPNNENEVKENKLPFMNNFSEETNALLNKYLPNNDDSIMKYSNNVLVNTNEFIRGIDKENQKNKINDTQINAIIDLKQNIESNYEKFKSTYVPNENEISSKIFFILSDIKIKIEEAEDLLRK